MESNYIIKFILNIINNINKWVQEHKNIEHKFFWRNFKIWHTILFESNTNWFQEWYFMWHVKSKNDDIYNYNYRILNKVTWSLEVCPIYNISGFLTQ